MSAPAPTMVPGPASIVALDGVSCGALAWRVKGQLRLTVIVKAAFAMVPGGPMAPADPEDIVDVEVHHRNAPTQSVRLTSDLLPFLPAADVVLTGHAHAPEGAPAQALTVRLALFRERALVEKLIHVYGDRKAPGAEVTPFEQIPLTYERAYGGLGSRDNPFGMGLGSGDRLPNLVDPTDAKKTTCFAPISASWPARKRLLDRAQQDGLKHAIHDIVGELDWQYFQAAPPDQRVPQYLKGNEWVVLDGMHPTQRSVQSRLPDAAGAARIYGLGEPDGRPVAMVADTLRIDADRMVCSVVWRGHVIVPDEATLASLEVVGGVSLGDLPIEWPARLEADVLEEYDSISGSGEAGSAAAPASIPPAASPSAPPAVNPLEGTMEASPDQLAGGRRPLPFVPGAAALPPVSRAVSRQVPSGTMDGTSSPPSEDGPVRSRTLPFAKGARIQLPPQRSAPPSPSLDKGSTISITPAEEEAPPRPSAFAMGLSPAPPLEEPSVAAPTFLKKAPRTLIGAASTPLPTATPAPQRAPARTALGIDLFPHGPLALELVPWGLTPARDTLTVIAKATCDLAPAGPAARRAAADPPTGEATAGPPPRCVYPSDLVPYKVRADVVLVGHAYAPGGSATEMEVVFRFGEDERAFDRTLLVFGDRRWEKGKTGFEATAPEPFVRMAIAFDHAFGGPRFGANPVGRGHHDPMHRGPVLLPNLEDPGQRIRSHRAAPPPAVFAPAPLAWKDRWAETHESGLCLADSLDWSRFQIAPPAQQLPFLRGDEPFALQGLSSRHPTLSGALPGLVARCFATWKGDSSRFEEVPLRLDTVVFDVDAMKVDLVWRGALPVADELAPEIQGLYLLADELSAPTPLAEARVKVLRP